MTFIRLLIFTILVPGIITGYVPYLLCNDKGSFDIGFLKYSGFVLVFAGVVFYLWSALSFFIQGKGTPAIWFTRILKFLIGEEPQKMVSSGLYKISRNPMYTGVIFIVTGESLLFESKNILLYSLFLILFFNVVVVFIEEPHLRKKFGKDYDEYLQKTSRWFTLKKRN